MNFAKLNWFQLRFPRELDKDGVLNALAAFSGAPSRARIVLELHADHAGIQHRLGVRTRDTESITATLRATIPSLRLTPTDWQSAPGHRLLLQTSPALAALRTDNLAATSADLLSSLFPLSEGESVCLRWRVQSWPLPPLPTGHYDAQDGRERIVRAKLVEPGMAAVGELMVNAPTRARRSQLRERTVSVLWSLRTPYGRLLPNEYWFGQLARLFLQRG
ncbi:MAG: hypothetical protein ACREMY_24340, partial [bacterium]